MYIQSITEQNGLVTVTICGGNDAFETFSVSVGRLKRISPPISEGMTVDEGLYGKIEHASAVTAAVRTAANLLSASDKSARMLKRRLIEKGISAEAAEDAVEFMIRKGYLNEERQASVYAEAAVRTKLYGKRRIMRELYAKGYDQSVIRQAADGISDEEYDAALRKYLDKTLRKSYNVDSTKIRKIAAAAQRLGHAPSAAIRYIKSHMAEDDLFDGEVD
ncbi:MAG: regulatory protein RecX [Ruminococcaceae bacterium]|nr:regulatory protein RecX [Oscillospiraceae bacterium]